MPVRVQLKREKGWRMPPDTIRVGRPSRWGNPFNATQVAVVLPWDGSHYPGIVLRVPPSLDRCLDLYAAWLLARVEQEPSFLLPLAGKNLGCWCAVDTPCHADILLRLANSK